MEYIAIILGGIGLGIAGIAWDYYKPSRFRTGYHNVSTKRDTILGGRSGLNGSEGLSGDGGCGGGN